MRLPRFLLRHTITVEPMVGTSGTGPVYGPPVPVRCHLAPSSRESQRRGAGDRVRRDTTSAFCDLEHVDLLGPDARVTVDGRVVEVLRIARHDYPGGPTPDHIEVAFI